uniref:Uncharacterized protein n=1 Tax=Arundo donax TaxID=35708 RepID=A0A0A9D8V4_ARUDO
MPQANKLKRMPTTFTGTHFLSAVRMFSGYIQGRQSTIMVQEYRDMYSIYTGWLEAGEQFTWSRPRVYEKASVRFSRLRRPAIHRSMKHQYTTT